jgi:hypothetical protein
MSAASSKRALTACSVLENSGILRQIFSYVGFGRWLYLVPVCKRWLEEYKVLAAELISRCHTPNSHGVYCKEHAADCLTVTFRRAAFTSVMCLDVAVAGGLRLFAPAGASLEEQHKSVHVQEQLGRFGSCDVLHHAHHHYAVPWSALLCAGAAASGDPFKLQWLHVEQQCPWFLGRRQIGTPETNVAVCAAMSENSLPILRWRKEECVDLSDRDLANYAAACGQLDTLQFLASEDHTFEGRRSAVCSNAAANGHLEVLQWLHAHGAPVSSALGDKAAEAGSVPMLAWLAEVLPPEEYWSVQGLTAMLHMAGCWGSLEACVWLRQQGAEWPDTLADDCIWEKGVWKQCVLEWARANGCTTEHPGFADYDCDFPTKRIVTFFRP